MLSIRFTPASRAIDLSLTPGPGPGPEVSQPRLRPHPVGGGEKEENPVGTRIGQVVRVLCQNGRPGLGEVPRPSAPPSIMLKKGRQGLIGEGGSMANSPGDHLSSPPAESEVTWAVYIRSAPVSFSILA